MKAKTILEWYQKQHKFIDAPCGGEGTCGRCKIKFQSNAPKASEKEQRLLSKEELNAGIRLACMTELPDGLEQVQMAGELDDDCAKAWVNFSPVNEEDWIHMSEKESCQQELYQQEPCAILLDLGTTTLAMSLVELSTGKQVAVVTKMNRQRSYGADVISRIKAANEGKLDKMRECILMDIVSLLKIILQQAHKDMADVKKILIAGNTTMCHILSGYSCVGLSRAPFKPVSLTMQEKTGADFFAPIEKNASEVLTMKAMEVVILPGISAFVGADIVMGIYACDMDLNDKISMFVDIGTNGEMVIGNADSFLVASTAAGPVFEGGNISCGMPATEGAITHVRLNGEWKIRPVPEDAKVENNLVYELFAGTKAPKGLCGSVLIDLAALLRKAEIIDENGTFCDAYFEHGFFVKSPLWDKNTSIILQQSDIRELQMGKSAIRSGLEILEAEMKKKDGSLMPEQIYLAGGFGAAIDIASAVEIGLFKESKEQKLIVAGNTVLAGLYKFLFDRNAKQRVAAIIEKSREISLAEHSDFEELYIHFMQF